SVMVSVSAMVPLISVAPATAILKYKPQSSPEIAMGLLRPFIPNRLFSLMSLYPSHSCFVSEFSSCKAAEKVPSSTHRCSAALQQDALESWRVVHLEIQVRSAGGAERDLSEVPLIVERR